MKLSLNVCLTTAAALALVPAMASADPPSPKEWAHSRVTQGLLKPLAEKESENSKFSRARPPPMERRLRVLSSTPSVDAQGRRFLAYEVDVRYGADWSQHLAGCVYEKTGNIFVQVGDEFRPSAYLLGKKVSAVPGVCQSPPPRDRS